jgi:hypothetical protein
VTEVAVALVPIVSKGVLVLLLSLQLLPLPLVSVTGGRGTDDSVDRKENAADVSVGMVGVAVMAELPSLLLLLLLSLLLGDGRMEWL